MSPLHMQSCVRRCRFIIHYYPFWHRFSSFFVADLIVVSQAECPSFLPACVVIAFRLSRGALPTFVPDVPVTGCVDLRSANSHIDRGCLRELFVRNISFGCVRRRCTYSTYTLSTCLACNICYEVGGENYAHIYEYTFSSLCRCQQLQSDSLR